MMLELEHRKRKPARNSTLRTWRSALAKWIFPAIGDFPLSEVKNSTVIPLIRTMAEAGLSASTIDVDFRLVKKVVASLVNEQGEPIYNRQWNYELLDIPIVEQHSLNRPCFDEETVNGLTRWRFPRERMLFTLEAASGGRVGELLGLDIRQHISADFTTLRIERQAYRGRIVDYVKTTASYREIDLHPTVAKVLQAFVGSRNSGLLFCTSKDTPLNLTNILAIHLHPALHELGFINSCTGTNKAGTHAFRRFRNTQMGKCPGLPDCLQKYWMGHRDPSMTGKYDKFAEDREFRKMWAQRCGIGFELAPWGENSNSREGEFDIYS